MAFARFPVVVRRLGVISQIGRCVSGGTTGSSSPPQRPPVSPPPPKGPATTSSSDVSRADPTKYNVPEYYEHNTFSYYDIDNAMTKFRLQQPSKFEPLKPKK